MSACATSTRPADAAVFAFLDDLSLGLPVLDVRCADDVHRQRLRNCTHIPWHQLPRRSFELPPREVPMALLLRDGDGLGQPMRPYIEEQCRCTAGSRERRAGLFKAL